MALKSPEDVGKRTAPPAVAAAEKDLSSSQGGQPEIAEGSASKPAAEEANGKPTHDRRHSLGDDPAAMTIEFLRARLLSERSASKSAKQRAQILAKRVVELEQRLEFEIGHRKKAESAIREALSKLTQAGLIVDSSAFFSFSTEVATVELEGRGHSQSQSQSGKQSANGNTSAGADVQRQAGPQDDEGSGKRGFSADEDSLPHNAEKGSDDVANANGDEESGSSDDAIQLAADVAEFQAQQKPIAWKGKKGDSESQCSSQPEEKRSPESLKSAWAVEAPSDGVDSPKRKNGRSLRRIQRRETRVVEERLKGMWNRLGEEMGTRREGQQQEDLDGSELLGWMGDVVNMLHSKPEKNAVSSNGSGDAKVNGGQEIDTDVHEGTRGSNGSAVKESKGGNESFTDNSNKSFEKLIAEYEAEEKAQRLWEKQYHAKHVSADSSLKQDVQARIPGPSAPADEPATISDLGSTPEAVTSAHQEKSREKEFVDASTDSPPTMNGDPDPHLSVQTDINKILSSEPDVSVSSHGIPEQTAEVLLEAAVPTPQVETQFLSADIEVSMPEAYDSLTERAAPELLSSNADVSGDIPEQQALTTDVVSSSEVQAPLAGAVSEVDGPREEVLVYEVQTPVKDSDRKEVQAPATEAAEIGAISETQVTRPTYDNSFEASNSTSASEGNGELSQDSQEHVPTLVQDDPSSMSSSAEQHDMFRVAEPASGKPPSGVKLQQDLLHEGIRGSHVAAKGAGRIPYSATSLDYRDEWLGRGPPPFPPEYGRRDMGEEFVRHRRAEYTSHGDLLYASRSQVEYQDAMAEELAYRRMESEYYAQERRHMAHFRSMSPLPGVGYDRDLYEQPGLQRSRSITNRPLYRSPEGAAVYEPERNQRSRSTGRGYPSDRGYRMYDIDDRFPYHGRSYGYDAAEHGYRTSFADEDLDFERARLRQERAFRDPLPRERPLRDPLPREQYRGMPPYPADLNSFERDARSTGMERRTSPGLAAAEQYRGMPQYPADLNTFEREPESSGLERRTSTGLERRASPDFHPTDYASPEPAPPIFGAEPDVNGKLGAGEGSSGSQGKHLSQSHEAVLKRETGRPRGEPMMKSGQPEYATQPSQRTPPSATQRRAADRTARAQGGPAQQPARNVQSERGCRASGRVAGASATAPQRKETTGRPSASRRQPSDRKTPAAAKVAPVEQTQTYLALPSYAGEGEENAETEGDKMRPVSDKQQPSKSPKKEGTKTATENSRVARQGQQQSPVAKEKNSPAAGAARVGPEDAKPILALPSYAGEGVGAETDDAYDQNLHRERRADVSASDASQFHQPVIDATDYGPSNGVQVQSQDTREMPRFRGDAHYRSQNFRGSSAHPPSTRGAQSRVGTAEPQYRRGARAEVARQAPSHSALPTYLEGGATFHDTEAMRYRGAERYNESVNFEGRSSRDRMSLGSEPAGTQYAPLRESQQHYQGRVEPIHGAQFMRDNLPARYHAPPAVGGRGAFSSGPFNSKEPLVYSPPSTDQAAGGNLGDILKALQLAKDRIRSSTVEHTFDREQYHPPELRPQATNTNMLPASRFNSSLEAGNPSPQLSREDMLRVPVQEYPRAEVMGHYTSDATTPFVRIPQSSSVSSTGMDSPSRPVFSRDEGNSLEGLTSTYVDKLNVGKGIQFFFP